MDFILECQSKGGLIQIHATFFMSVLENHVSFFFPITIVLYSVFVFSIHPSIHCVYLLLLAVVVSSGHWARGVVYPGQVTKQSQKLTVLKNNAHIHT